MKRNTFYILACFVIGSLSLSSCLKDKDYTPTPVAGLTMVNGYPDDQGIVYYADQRPAPQLAYKIFGGTDLFSGNRNIIVKGINSNKVLADTTLAFKDSAYYSSFIFGTKDQPMHIITEDKLMQSSANAESAGIRFFNLAQIDGKVSLQIGDKAIETSFKNRSIENQTSATANQGFIAQESGTFKLSILNEAGDPIVTRESVKLTAKRYYSVILIGKKGDSATPLYIGIVGPSNDN